MQIVALIWRLVVLTVSLLISSIIVVAAGLYAIANHILLADPAAAGLSPDQAVHSFGNLFAFVMAAILAATHVFAPWIVAIAVTEILRWRSVLVHVAAGAIVAISATVLSGAILLVPGLPLVAALGILGGFTHWLIAGHSAGRWSEGMLGPADDSTANHGGTP
jgi:hypothetical protein